MTRKNSTLQLIHLIFASLFLVAAILQYNDPDPLVWGTYYLMATFGAVMYGTRRPIPAVAWICVGASLVFLLQCLTGVFANFQHPDGMAIGSMSAERPEIEETREFGGATVVLIWACLALLVKPKRPSLHTSSSAEKPNSANQ
jgi:hypothetical protein